MVWLSRRQASRYQHQEFAEPITDDPVRQAFLRTRALNDPRYESILSAMRRKYRFAYQAAVTIVQENFKDYDRYYSDISMAYVSTGYCGHYAPYSISEQHSDGWHRPVGDEPDDIEADAFEHVVVRESLRRHRYPQAILLAVDETADRALQITALRDFARLSGSDVSELDGINFMDELFKINARLDAMESKLPKIEGAGCGGPEPNLVYLRTNPPGARLWVVSHFRFLYCQNSGIDPWDRQQCRYWYFTDPNQIVDIWGAVTYQIRWANGTWRRDRLLVRSTNDGSPTVITLR